MRTIRKAAERKARRKAKAKRIGKRPSHSKLVAKADKVFSLIVRSVGRCSLAGIPRGPASMRICFRGATRARGGPAITRRACALGAMSTTPIGPWSGMTGCWRGSA